ncbi:high affinity cationic amino acid transporter 1-like [Onthophagus taurus]|uniref:high affinity cationic amino acid transporter 1-like n=1 Tax=Onthophagus taurus TaxID=166361 RepID=UPI0039BEA4B7
MNKIIKALFRKKPIDLKEKSELKRVLGLWDLTFLGLGVTLGLGTYVLAGSVAKIHAGPAVCISFFIAAVASALAGLCYAEFACRVPKAGSAYIYSYVTMGEFIAYIIGWNLVLEYVIGTAGLARGLSDYIDALTNNTISTAFRDAMPIDVEFLSSYPDFFSLAMMIILIVVMSNGAKESSMLNSILTVLNIIVVLIVVGFGAAVINFDFWSISKENIPPDVRGGEGGFAPFGLQGILTGAAQCFFAFVGFDAVATTADEARNPQRMIPLAIILCLFISFLAYFGVSTVLTLMCPYYEQDDKAPFPAAFDYAKWPSIKWVASVGAIIAMASTLVANLFTLPRILYSMAKDGLLFKQLSYISERTKTPVIATIATGLFAGIMATIFDINQLVEMLSIGTLIAYTIVSLCVLMLRYTPINNEIPQNGCMEHKSAFHAGFHAFKIAFNLNGNKYPNKLTNSFKNWSIIIFCLLSIAICVCMKFPMFTSISHPHFLAIFVILLILLLATVVVVARQPEQEIELSFKVPLVPLIPFTSIFINILLMSMSKLQTFVRIAAWLGIGLLIYFGYGIWHSKERESIKRNQQVTTANGVDVTRL